MEQGSLGVYPELHTPPLPATHVEVGTGIEHLPELRHHHLALQTTQLLNTCDLASHDRVTIALRGSGSQIEDESQGLVDNAHLVRRDDPSAGG